MMRRDLTKGDIRYISVGKRFGTKGSYCCGINDVRLMLWKSLEINLYRC